MVRLLHEQAKIRNSQNFSLDLAFPLYRGDPKFICTLSVLSGARLIFAILESLVDDDCSYTCNIVNSLDYRNQTNRYAILCKGNLKMVVNDLS